MDMAERLARERRARFAAERLPLTLIRRIAACAFALLALYAGYQALSLAGLV